jgi:hypothetical protein
MSRPLRRVGTALLTPIIFGWRTGHFRSSLKMRALSRRGEPLPWYTYPCIDFLRCRSYENRTVLEFGAGQSTLWWARRARAVVSFEGDDAWLGELRTAAPPNVELHPAPMETPAACVAEIDRILAAHPTRRFDVVVIDGLWRSELIGTAARVVSDDGIILCDDAEGYGFHEAFRNLRFQRVDFFGFAPGVMRQHCTSIYFRPGSFVFDRRFPIPVASAD